MSHIFVLILTDMFNHWFTQGAIPGSITKGVITLLKKGGRHVWEEQDNYRLITLLNTELNISARVLANRLQLVISDLIGPKHNYAVKGRSIQDNLNLVREILEGIKDDTSRGDHFRSVQGLRQGGPSVPGDGFGDRRIRTGVPQMDQHDVPQPAGGGPGEREAFKGFRDRAIGPAGLPLSPLLYVLALEPLLRRLRDEGACLVLCGVSLTGCVWARVSAYADDITVFVSRDWTYWKWKRQSRGTKKWQVPRSTLTRAKACSWVLGGVASLCRGPSAGSGTASS